MGLPFEDRSHHAQIAQGRGARLEGVAVEGGEVRLLPGFDAAEVTLLPNGKGGIEGNRA